MGIYTQNSPRRNYKSYLYPLYAREVALHNLPGGGITSQMSAVSLSVYLIGICGGGRGKRESGKFCQPP